MSMFNDLSRRAFIQFSGSALTAGAFMPAVHALGSTLDDTPDAPLFRISLAQWSLHRAHFNGSISAMDFPKVAKEEFGIDAVEYVNQFFKDKAEDHAWLDDLKKRCEDLQVRSLLIMIDGEGALGHPDEAQRTRSVENHYKWVEAAKRLGCHSIRVNAESRGTWNEQVERAADGLRRLTLFAAERGMNVIVENHGGLSSNGKWLVEVMKTVDHPRCGTLPDFGNFCLDWSRRDEAEAWYDRYLGVEELMPFAKAVSAKSHDFNEAGDETATDYMKMMTIVLKAGYRGDVGIEYEGGRLDEHAGIRATKQLLERTRERLTRAMKDAAAGSTP